MATRSLFSYLGLLLLAATPSLGANVGDTTYVRFNTSIGNIDVQLFSVETPNTVANFLKYVDAGAYNNSIIDRNTINETPYVIQGGDYYVANASLNAIANLTTTTLDSEAGISNQPGTIAMALSAQGVNSATSAWFFNEADNSAALDGMADGGPFTVFGAVANTSSMSVMYNIGNLPVPVTSVSGTVNSSFPNLPLLNYTSGNSVEFLNLVYVYSVTRLTIQNYSTWQSKFTTQELSEPNFIGPTDIPFNDNVPNLVKYFCDIDPSVPMSAHDRSMLPTVGTVTSSGTTYLTLTYRQSAEATNLMVNIQTSTDLKTWTSVLAPIIVSDGTDTTTTPNDPIYQVQIPMSGTALYLRWSVSQP